MPGNKSLQMAPFCPSERTNFLGNNHFRFKSLKNNLSNISNNNPKLFSGVLLTSSEISSNKKKV